MADEVSTLTAAVDAVVGLELADAPVETLRELLAATRQAIDRLSAKRLNAVRALAESGAWALDGSRSLASHLARVERTRLVAARGEAKLAETVAEHLPLAREAALAGDLTTDHLRALTQAADTEARQALLRDPVRGERHLVAQARRLGADQFGRAVASWAAKADPQADEREQRDLRATEHVDLRPTREGWDLSGFLAPESGQLLRTALDAVVGVPSSDDTRTPGQRDAGGLVGLARLALDSGEHGARAAVRPHLSVHVSWESLVGLAGEAGVGITPAWLPDGRPLPRWLLERIACDSEVTRVVFGPKGQVLDVGRTKRLFTGAQRRALEARDQHCVWRGCLAPPSQCEGHHLRGWEAGGKTSLDNGALLCWFHHDFLHQHHLTLSRDHDPGGGPRWVVTRDDGSAFADWPVEPPPSCGDPPRLPLALAATGTSTPHPFGGFDGRIA